MGNRNHLSRLTPDQTAHRQAEYTYDEVGNRTRVDLHNGTYTTYDYSGTDPRYFVTEIGHYDSSNALLTSAPISYNTRDDSGNPTEIRDWDDPSGRAYTYDANNRLTSGGGTSYGYDWVGNRLNPPADPSPMTYDATDKLLLWPGQQSFTYHPTGSLKEQWNASKTTLNKTWSYTGAELVSSVIHRDVTYDSEMEWDGDSNRVSFTSSNTDTTWDFVYDTTASIPAVIEEVTPADGSFYYVREPGGELIARVEGSTGAPPVLYYHFDELGSTRLLTNGSGIVTDTYTYDAWGKQVASTGSTPQPYRYVGQLGYYSHYQDTNLFSQNGYQFLQLGVRFYDALTGRFTQMDPVPSEYCAYCYVGDSPLRNTDATGCLTDAEKDYYLCVGKCVVRLVVPGADIASDLIQIKWPRGRPPAKWWEDTSYLKKLKFKITLPKTLWGSAGPSGWKTIKSCFKRAAFVLVVVDLLDCLGDCVKTYGRKLW